MGQYYIVETYNFGMRESARLNHIVCVDFQELW